MIDIKKLTENPDQYKKYLKLRGNDPEIIDQIIQIDKERRSLTGQVERLRNEKKESSKDFGKAKKEGSSISQIEKRIKDISSKLDDEEKKLTTVEEKYHDLILTIPNVLLDDVSDGKDEKDNVVVRTWGEKPKTKFKPHDHVEIGEKLKIIDLKRASKVAGARFAFMCGLGAKLERALISFMLDIHTDEHGYLEIIPPLIVNVASLIGTGQLPKFSDELFKLEKFPYYLIPTSEVPVTNYFADEIIDFERLPIKFAAFSPCFRSEAGSYGKETRGITRQHHFNKVELVKFTTPEKSTEEHESLTRDAERILQLLGLHYRVVSLCCGEIGFGAAKCYDIEVWLPSINVYKEISSCSNYLDFQARRAKIRYRDPETGKPALVHTINGSGLAIGRTIIAILEQYQNEDGSVTLPEVLRSYMGDIEKLS